MDKIIKLIPCYVEKVWGYEKWILSTHKNGVSNVEGYEKNFKDYIGKELPILIKEIKADENLSVQVHPNDEYASKHENELGKTECWYILDAKEDATLICGIKNGVTKEEFTESLNKLNVEHLLKKVPVKKGDMIYIPAGTVHAIEGGIKILEVQQSSDVTYRIYDWGRDREVHIDDSLNVIDFSGELGGGKLDKFDVLDTPYFTVEKFNVLGNINSLARDNYEVYISICGSGFIRDELGREISINELDVIYIHENTIYSMEGNMELLRVFQKTKSPN